MFGFLNVYKPVGKTSHDVVGVLRRVLKIKQIGHTGTLDPFAEGVLPICIGKSTRLIEYLPDDKSYRAFVKFGISTDTYDTEGKVICESEKKVSAEEVLAKLKTFEGEIEQIPPMYSAIKVSGKKLYEYAREGKTVEVKPRKVNIYKIELVEFDFENQTAQIDIECSKGTYIRSIAHDLGENLGCGAHLFRLIRTSAGHFRVEDSVKLDEFVDKETVQKNLIYPLEMLDLARYELNSEEAERVSHGMPLLNKNINNDDFLILVYNNSIRAVAKVNGGVVKVNKVFEDD